MKHHIFVRAGRWYVVDPLGQTLMGSVFLEEVLDYAKRVWPIHRLFVATAVTQ